MKDKMWLVLLGTLLLGGLGGYLVAPDDGGERVETAPDAVQQPLFYRNPMNPAVTSPVPAKDQMGMDYIPVYANGGGANGGGAQGPAGTVSIDSVTVQNIGVRTARVVRDTLTRVIRTSGRVDYNEERLTRLHPKTEGWIEKLLVDATGQTVSANDILLSIYSPDLVTSQEEYLLALKNAETLADSSFPDIRKGAENLLESSRERLHMLDVPHHQIVELEATRKVRKNLHIHSPFNGVVVSVGAREGQYVTPKTELYTIADLSKVWVYVDVFDSELPWVNAGDHAEMRLKGVPGRVFGGLIRYVYPYADAATRTVKVRLEFDNPDGLLRPDLFADVTIHADRQVNALVIPSEAVVRSGARDQVFVVRAPGKFEPREVVLGVVSDGRVQVLSGVAEGEEVVTSAQFLIDSESKLSEATAKMLGERRAPDATSTPVDGATGMTGMTGHDMDSGDMSGHDMSGHDMGSEAMPGNVHAGH